MLRKLALSLLLGGVTMPCFAQEADLLLPPAATESPEMINQLHQREWVRLDASGRVLGTVKVVAEPGKTEARIGARVLLSKDGEVLMETKTDIDGSFEFDGIKPDTYAIQVLGDLTRAAYALHVLPHSTDHLGSELEVFASVIPAARASELVGTNLSPEWSEQAQDVYYRVHENDPIADERRFNDSHQVVLRDGDLIGRVSRPGWTFPEQDLSGTIAQIVKEGEVVAQAPVMKDGYFTVKRLNPGVYDLFVSGDDGFAVLAFEAVNAIERTAMNGSKSPRLVSANLGISADCLCCEMIQQPEISCCEVIVEEIIPCDTCGVDPCGCAGEVIVDGLSPVAGGGFAGPGGFYGGGGGFGGGGFGGGGFGGGGGGLGGIGGLAGLAGLAIGVTALADDDDGFNLNQASPIVP